MCPSAHLHEMLLRTYNFQFHATVCTNVWVTSTPCNLTAKKEWTQQVKECISDSFDIICQVCISFLTVKNVFSVFCIQMYLNTNNFDSIKTFENELCSSLLEQKMNPSLLVNWQYNDGNAVYCNVSIIYIVTISGCWCLCYSGNWYQHSWRTSKSLPVN